MRFPFVFFPALFGFSPSFGKPNEAESPTAIRIVVIGDIHGDFKRFVEALRLAEVIDSKNRWIAENTQLVQLGDLADRGPDTMKVIELLRELEKSALSEGGQVHVLIGNHDAMNMYGDLRYTHKGEFTAFATKKSDKLLEELYESEVEWIQENVSQENWPDFDEAHRAEWLDQRPPGFFEHRLSWLPNGDIGKWMLDHNTVLKIGRNLFVHAGIGPAHANDSIESINTGIRDSLRSDADIDSTILLMEDGPLWYRGFALSPESEEIHHLNTVLSNFNVERIIIGHTPTNGVILPRFGAKVILADVGLSEYYGGNLACLLIEDDELTAIYRNGRLKIPTEPDLETLIAYLEKVARLETGNSSLPKRIKSLRKGKEALEEYGISE